MSWYFIEKKKITSPRAYNWASRDTHTDTHTLWHEASQRVDPTIANTHVLRRKRYRHQIGTTMITTITIIIIILWHTDAEIEIERQRHRQTGSSLLFALTTWCRGLIVVGILRRWRLSGPAFTPVLLPVPWRTRTRSITPLLLMLLLLLLMLWRWSAMLRHRLLLLLLRGRLIRATVVRHPAASTGGGPALRRDDGDGRCRWVRLLLAVVGLARRVLRDFRHPCVHASQRFSCQLSLYILRTQFIFLLFLSLRRIFYIAGFVGHEPLSTGAEM